MFKNTHLCGDNGETNIISDYTDKNYKISYTNETKKNEKIHNIIIFMKITKLEKNFYGKSELSHGFNFYLLNKKNYLYPLFDDNKKIKTNDDLIKYNFDLKLFPILTNACGNKPNRNYNIFKFDKKLPEPIILKPLETFYILLNDDFTLFEEHKILIDITS